MDGAKLGRLVGLHVVGAIGSANVGTLKTVFGTAGSELALSMEASEGKAVGSDEGPEGTIVGKAVVS